MRRNRNVEGRNENLGISILVGDVTVRMGASYEANRVEHPVQEISPVGILCLGKSIGQLLFLTNSKIKVSQAREEEAKSDGVPQR